jgi:hypothetical protein
MPRIARRGPPGHAEGSTPGSPLAGSGAPPAIQGAEARARLKAMVAELGSQRDVASRLRSPMTGEPLARSALSHWIEGRRSIPMWVWGALRRLRPRARR